MSSLARSLVVLLLVAVLPAVGQDERKFFDRSRKDPPSPVRRDTAAALARIAKAEDLPRLLAAFEENGRELSRLAQRVQKLSADVDRLKAAGSSERELSEASADMNLRRREIAELVRETTILRGALRDVVRDAPAAARDGFVRAMVGKATNTNEAELRREFLRLLALVRVPGARECVASVLAKHADPVARADAATALGEAGTEPEVEAALVPALSDAFEVVRAAAVRSLFQVGGKEAVEALIAAIPRETGRLQGDVIAALRRLTGVNFHDNVALWREWWDRTKSEFRRSELGVHRPTTERRGDRERERRAGTHFYGIQTPSDALVYLIDVSGSMAEPAAPEGVTGSGARDETKLDRAKRELTRSIGALPTGVRVNVIAYADELHPFSGAPVVLDDASRRSILGWVRTLSAKGETNLFDALESTLLSARGERGRPQKEMPVDTVFVLTDGLPTAGKVQDAEILASEVARLNEVPRLVIHTIGIGPGHAAGLLRRIAEESFGDYVAAR